MQINSTIFKTWLNDINKVALAMDGLQSITQFKTGSTIANGMELSTVAVNKYKASIEGLSLSQAKTVLSTTALNEAQQKQILISAGLLNTTESLTLAEVKEMASSMSLSAQKKEEILTTLQGAYSEGKWNEQRLLAIKEAGGEAGAIAEVILAKKTENAENLKRIASNKSLNAVLKEQLLLLLKNPFTWIVVGTAAAVVAIDLFTESLAEAQEKAEKSKQTYDDLVSELSTLRQEADTTREKIDELQKLADNGTISLVEQNELDKLKETNEELEREIRLKEYAAQMAGKEASDDAVNAITKKSETYSTGSVDPNTPVSELPRNASQIYTAQEDRIDAFQRRIDSATVKQEELNVLIEKQKEIEQSFGNEADKYAEDSEWKKLQNQVNAKKSEIQTVEKEMSDYYDALSSEDDALRDEYGNIIEGAEETISRLEAVYKSFDLYGAGGQTAVDKVVEYFGDSNNKSVVDALQDAYNSFTNGDISKSALYSMEEYQAVMDETGISASYLEQHLRDLAKAKKELGSQNPDKIPVSFDYENLDGLESKVSSIQSAYDTLISAMRQYNEQGYLDMDMIDNLITLDDAYINVLIDENGQLQYNHEAFKNLAEIKLEEAKASVYQEFCNELARIKLLETKIAANELELANGTLAESAYETAKALYEEYIAMDNIDSAHKALAQNAWEATEKKVALLDNQLKNVTASTYNFAKSSGSASKTTKKEFSETVDFMTERIEELTNALDLLKANLESVVGSFAKNTLIDAQIGINKESINNYSNALDMYTAKANEALSKLPSDIAEKVQNGAVSLTTFMGDNNEQIVENIKEYDKWSDAVHKCQSELANLKEAIRDLELEKFNNIISDFTDKFDFRENSIDIIDKQIALFEEAGQLIGESFFVAQKDQASKQLGLLKEQQSAMADQLSSALSSGNIEVGTDEWIEMVGSLQEVEGQIIDCKKSIEEFDNAILDLNWQVFERIQDTFSNLDSELDNLVGLFDDIDVFDNGDWTTDAITKLGLLSQQYELAQYNVAEYNDAIAKLKQQYANGSYSATEYADKLAELSDGMWENANAVESVKKEMIALHEQRVDEEIDGINQEISAYEELIQSKIDALSAEKD